MMSDACADNTALRAQPRFAIRGSLFGVRGRGLGRRIASAAGVRRKASHMTLMHWCFVAFIVAIPAQPPAGQAQPAAQKPPQEVQKTQPAIKAEDLPVDLDRIQRALANTPRLRFDEKDRP